jgi:hypothetical protein
MSGDCPVTHTHSQMEQKWNKAESGHASAELPHPYDTEATTLETHISCNNNSLEIKLNYPFKKISVVNKLMKPSVCLQNPEADHRVPAGAPSYVGGRFVSLRS